MSNINISDLALLSDLEDRGKSVIGGFSRRRNRQSNNFGFDAVLVGDINQVTVANSQGNSIGGDQVVIANAQANLAVGRGHRQDNYGDFWVVL